MALPRFLAHHSPLIPLLTTIITVSLTLVPGGVRTVGIFLTALYLPGLLMNWLLLSSSFDRSGDLRAYLRDWVLLPLGLSLGIVPLFMLTAESLGASLSAHGAPLLIGFNLALSAIVTYRLWHARNSEGSDANLYSSAFQRLKDDPTRLFMAFAILCAGLILLALLFPPEAETYTTLYMDSAGIAGGQAEVSPGDTLTVRIGIKNHEGMDASYGLVAYRAQLSDDPNASSAPSSATIPRETILDLNVSLEEAEEETFVTNLTFDSEGVWLVVVELSAVSRELDPYRTTDLRVRVR